ncbi:MAG TPA: EAL domain-containing protein, partial [Azonexus sp.]|nr:EAL domain-containing protein [Azonexus sp.]
AVASAVVTLARRLGLSVVAEGVETEAQRQFLGDIGCDLLQGFLFARPLPVAEFEDWLGQRPA